MSFTSILAMITSLFGGGWTSVVGVLAGVIGVVVSWKVWQNKLKEGKFASGIDASASRVGRHVEEMANEAEMNDAYLDEKSQFDRERLKQERLQKEAAQKD